MIQEMYVLKSSGLHSVVYEKISLFYHYMKNSYGVTKILHANISISTYSIRKRDGWSMVEMFELHFGMPNVWCIMAKIAVEMQKCFGGEKKS